MYKIYTINYGRPPGYLIKLLVIMKLTILILITTLMQVSAATFAQKVTLKENGLTMERMFREIRKQTGYNVIMDNSKLTKSRINANFEDTPLIEVMNFLVKGTDFTYTIEDKVIVIKEKTLLDRLSATVKAVFKSIDVKGKVVDQDGKPLPNASIRVKGKSSVTNTNAEGLFELKGLDEDAVLMVSYVGFKTLEIPLKDAVMPLEIKLNVATGELEEVKVVYNTGYQELNKERATGSFEHIDNELLNRRVGSNLLDRIEGVASGVLFNKNIALTNIPEVSIRSRSTIISNVQPLIIVDNFPFNGDVNTINPSDIESIDILKDAATSSVWGAFSGNGVIVITTKKGQLNQALKVDVNTNFSLTEKPDQFYDKNFLSSNEFIDLEKQLWSQNYYAGQLTNPGMPPISPVIALLVRAKAGTISEAEANKQIDQYRNYDIRNDLNKFFYRNAFTQRHSLSLQGGSSKTTYRFSVGYDNNSSNQIGNKNDRLTLNSFNTFLPIKNLRVTTGLEFSIQQNQSNSILSQIATGGPSAMKIYPYARVADQNGNALNIVKDFRASFLDSAVNNGFLNWRFSPLDELRNKTNSTNSIQNHLRFSTGLKYQFIKGVSLEVLYQLEKQYSEEKRLNTQQSYFARDLINRYSIVSSGKVTGYNIPVGGILDRNQSNLISHNLRANIAYNKTWKDHSFTTIAAIDVRQIIGSTSGYRLYGYDDNLALSKPYNPLQSFTLNPTGTGSLTIPTNIFDSGTTDRYRSYTGNAVYSFRNRYTFSISGRIDQSNIFGVKTNQQSIPLWSTGLKWDVSKEEFYNSQFLPKLVLRVSYGYNGNVNKSLSAYTTVNYATSGNIYGSYTQALINSLGNPELRWEKNRTINVGIDFTFFKDVILGSFDIYHRKGNDLLGPSPLPSSSGLLSFTGNYLDMTSKGVDLKLRTNIINNIFRWSIDALLSNANEKVTKLKTNISQYSALEGKPVYGIYGFKWGGLDELTGDPIGLLNGVPSKVYSTLNIQALDQQSYKGSQLPVWFGGFRNTFSWQNISCSFNLTYKFGHYFKRKSINYNTLLTAFGGHEDYNSRWKNPGDEKNTNIPSMPALVNPARDQFYNGSEVLIEKADHVRLQDITLSYQLKKIKIGQMSLKNIDIYGYAGNLGILWRANKKGIDPDFQNGVLPLANYSLGLKMAF